MKTKDTEIARNKLKSESDGKLDNVPVPNRKQIRHDVMDDNKQPEQSENQ